MCTQLAKIVQLEVTGTRSGINPCVSLNKGINTASRVNGAGFRLDFNFVFVEGGNLKTAAHTILVKGTTEIGDTSKDSVAVQTSFDISPNKVDLKTPVTATVQVVLPGSPLEVVSEPQTDTFDECV